MRFNPKLVFAIFIIAIGIPFVYTATTGNLYAPMIIAHISLILSSIGGAMLCCNLMSAFSGSTTTGGKK